MRIPALLLFSLWLSFSCFAQSDNEESNFAVTVFGGAGQVSGSLTILDSDYGSWMVDCGLYYPDGDGDGRDRAKRAQRESLSLPAGAPSVDAVFLTHAHLDHIGRLPLLVQEGYSGPIFGTSLTLDLAKPMLLMQLRYDQDPNRTWVWSKRRTDKAYRVLHWEPRCQWANRINPIPRYRGTQKGSFDAVSKLVRPKGSSPCKTCGELALKPIIDKFRPAELEEWIALAGGVRTRPIDAGHIPGSSSWLFELKDRGKVKTVLFSGDVGNPHSTLLKGPKPIPIVDYLFVETTYGCKTLAKDPIIELWKFRKKVGEVIQQGGVAWIPSFALDRTQKVLHQIQMAKESGLIPSQIPVLCPSPTAKAVSGVYESHRIHDGFRNSWRNDPLNLRPEGFSDHYFDGLPVPPVIVVTTSGMMERAFSEGLLDQLLPEEKVTVFLVGYQDPFSPGGRLKEGVRELVLPNGETTVVRAKVEFVSGLSSHGKADDLDLWMENQDKETTQVFLVHGDASALQNRKQCLVDQDWGKVTIPKRGQLIQLFD